MSAIQILGTKSLVETSARKESSDRDVKIITVEGPYDILEKEPVDAWRPSGYSVASSLVESTGEGMGKMTIRCVKYNEGQSFAAERTTFRVDMQEVTYDLEDHPYLEDERDVILKWLATEESKRVDANKYYYTNKSGTLVEIKQSDNPFAVKFVKAYMSGIRTFNRYYPVVELVSVYKNPPGVNPSGLSFASGSPDFSPDVGKYANPPIRLNGYPNGNWFKSKDSWVQNANTTWTRTEQWTYTPEASNGQNGWIYTSL